MARVLALGRTLIIGVIRQAIDSPFHGEALRAIEQQLQQSTSSAYQIEGAART